MLKVIRNIASRYGEIAGEPREVVPAMPMRYQIEPANFCNLDCPTCYSANLDETRKWLRLGEFIKIAEQIPAGAHISFYNWGEPFLNPDMVPIIREGARRGLLINIHSHFNFKPELVPEIVDSGLNVLSASIDGTTQQNYEKFRRKGSFDLAWKNFSRIAELKAERGVTRPALVWQYIVNRYNEHEMDRARELVAGLPSPAKIDFIPIQLRREKVDWDQYSPEEMERMKEEWLPENPLYVLPHHVEESSSAVIDDTRCPWLWREMVINVSGRVTPCCHTYKPEFAFGNLNDSTLEEIWNNEAYVSSRRMFLDPEYEGCTTICSRCPNYVRIPKRGMVRRQLDFAGWAMGRTLNRVRRMFGGSLADRNA